MFRVKIPLIWKEWQPAAERDFEKKTATWKDNERKRLQRLARGQGKPSDAKPAEEPTLRMHPEDAENFLKLAAALKIAFGRTVRVADLARAKRLLFEYLEGYQRVISPFVYTTM